MRLLRCDDVSVRGVLYDGDDRKLGYPWGAYL
jgi:hypothetical protein